MSKLFYFNKFSLALNTPFKHHNSLPLFSDAANVFYSPSWQSNFSIWFLQRNCYHYALLEHKSNSLFHLMMTQISLTFVAGVLQSETLALLLFIICLNYTLWMLIDLLKENGFTLKMQEADDIPQKLSRMQIMSIILCFSQIHLCKLNICCISWNRQQEALVSMWTQIKQSLCVLNKMAPSPH